MKNILFCLETNKENNNLSKYIEFINILSNMEIFNCFIRKCEEMNVIMKSISSNITFIEDKNIKNIIDRKKINCIITNDDKLKNLSIINNKNNLILLFITADIDIKNNKLDGYIKFDNSKLEDERCFYLEEGLKNINQFDIFLYKRINEKRNVKKTHMYLLSKRVFCFLNNKLKIFRFLSDEKYIKLWYKYRLDKYINLDNPVLLNEKLQKLKLIQRNELYTKLVDKYEVKDYVKKLIGEKYIIPTIGCWDNFKKIDFKKLPEKFVLKTTHDSSKIIACTDQKKFDYGLAKVKIKKQLKNNYYYNIREWPYKNVKPQIIAEPFLTNKDGTSIVDYKFYCFDGEPEYFMYSLGEAEHNARNHKFDMELNSIDKLFKEKEAISLNNIKLPDNINEMIEIVKKMCRGYKHIRIDLYNINGKIYFGEYTFYSGGGILNIKSKEFENYLSNKINLEEENDD